MFNWGFIGSGTICKNVSKQLLKNKKHKISCVWSRTYEHANAFAKSISAKTYKTINELLNDKTLDAIYIGTPHSSHFKYAKMALERGIPVLLEKAFTLSYENTLKLLEIAKKNNTYICEAMWTWFSPVALTVKEWFSANKIGKPLTMRSNFCVPTFFRKKERIFNKLYGGGSLLDLGIYPIAYAYNLFGYPDDIKASAKMKNGVDLDCKITLTYNSGLICELRSSINRLGSCSTTIIGENGKIKVPAPMHCSRKAFLKGKENIKYHDSYPFGLYENEFNLVEEEIKQEKKESSYVPFSSTLNVMKIIEEIKKQIGLSYDEANSL
ncbi:MAG: Gfo/Idh/MocA family oxidoreductase [Bacilli bacterium]|nr:Gfo/Idh/MocA family oxidoreductase [Bacilli bacterium]